jgi:prepilin-type N-terminal cleavage/methylation domain-containing protein
MMFRNVKKGFTFVELAIVLVIIGIIMGMALKGRSLIEGAKTRSEIRKLEKIQAAVAGWYSNTGSASTPADFQRLSGTTPPSCDAASGGTAAPSAAYSQGRCLDVKVLKELRSNDVTTPFGDNWTMIGGSWDNATILQGDRFILITAASPRFACNVESIMDDKYFLFGDARASYNERRVNDGEGGRTPIFPQNLDDDPVFMTCDEWNNTYDNTHFVGYELSL